MKLMIASDIHGSLYYAQKLLGLFEQEKADKLLLLGDFLYHGPRNPLPRKYEPSEVAKLLNQYSHKIIAVRGNCDSEVDQMVLDFPIQSTYAQLVVDKHTFFMTHGHVYHPKQLPNLSEKVVFLSGHTHIPQLYQDEKSMFVIVNPGSITLPKGNNQPSYAIYGDHQIEVKTIEGDVLFSYHLS